MRVLSERQIPREGDGTVAVQLFGLTHEIPVQPGDRVQVVTDVDGGEAGVREVRVTRPDGSWRSVTQDAVRSWEIRWTLGRYPPPPETSRG